MQNYLNPTPPHQSARKKSLRLAVTFCMILVLAACGSIKNLPVTDESYRNWAGHQIQMGNINSWEIHARAAIFVEQEVYQVGINWQRELDLFVIVIEAPFGQGVFRIESNQSGDGRPSIKLSLPDEQVFYDESAEALLVKFFGWPIPVSGLKSWIKGLPLRDTEYDFDLQADGRLKSLRQDGWLINYLEYFTGDHMSKGLPRKMYLKHANLALKIVIDRWQQIESETKSPVIFPDFD